MALYNPDNFVEDIRDKLNISHHDAEELRTLVLHMRLGKALTWEKYNDKLKALLTNFMKERKPDFKLPEVDPDREMTNVMKYTKAKTYEDILLYLGDLKGRLVEDNLKHWFLKSQNEEEQYNYFARLFEVRGDMFPKQRMAFRCCYAELLMTQQISRLILNYLIMTFAKRYKDGIDLSLEKQISADKGYEKLGVRGAAGDRGSLLHLVYAISFLDEGDEPETGVKRSKEILLSVLYKDDYNPKSFLDMIYYYAIMNLLPYKELKSLLRRTAFLVITNLFGDKMIPAARAFSESSIAEIESFLNFNHASIEKVLPFLQEVDSSMTLKAASSTAEQVMDKMGVNYFDKNVYDRKTDTYDYYLHSVEPKIICRPHNSQYLTADKFCEWMAQDRRYYESYYGIQSKTRTQTLGGELQLSTSTTEAEYAYLIVHRDLLHVSMDGYKGLGKKKWKETVLGIFDTKSQIEEIEKRLERVFFEVSLYKGQKKNIVRAREYEKADRRSLVNAILAELSSSKERRYAIEIVHKDTLSALELEELQNRDGKNWKEYLRSLSEEERLRAIKEMFTAIFEKLSPSKDSLSSEKGDKDTEKKPKRRVGKVKRYADFDVKRDKLFRAISAEIQAPVYPDTECDEMTKVYAREIVQFDSLADLDLPAYTGLNTLQWKNRMREIEDKDERILAIRKLLHDTFREINRRLDNRESDKADDKTFEDIKALMHIDITDLAKGVNDELFRKEFNAYYSDSSDKRSEYVFAVFQDCIEENADAIEFQMRLSDDGDHEHNDLVKNRWAFFSPTRYQDAMLYMCLNSGDPKRMFEKINSTPGYAYDEN